VAWALAGTNPTNNGNHCEHLNQAAHAATAEDAAIMDADLAFDGMAVGLTSPHSQAGRTGRDSPGVEGGTNTAALLRRMASTDRVDSTSSTSRGRHRVVHDDMDIVSRRRVPVGPAAAATARLPRRDRRRSHVSGGEWEQKRGRRPSHSPVVPASARLQLSPRTSKALLSQSSSSGGSSAGTRR